MDYFSESSRDDYIVIISSGVLALFLIWFVILLYICYHKGDYDRFVLIEIELILLKLPQFCIQAVSYDQQTLTRSIDLVFIAETMSTTNKNILNLNSIK